MSRADFACLFFYLLHAASFHTRLPMRTARLNAAANFFIRDHANVSAHFFVQFGADLPSLRPIFQRVLQPHDSPTPISAPHMDPRATLATLAPSTPQPRATAGKSSPRQKSADQTVKFRRASR